SRYVPAYYEDTDLASRYERPDSKCFINRSARCSISKERPVELTYLLARRSNRRTTERRSRRNGRKFSPRDLLTVMSRPWSSCRMGVNAFLLSTIICPCQTGTPVRFACSRFCAFFTSSATALPSFPTTSPT